MYRPVPRDFYRHETHHGHHRPHVTPPTQPRPHGNIRPNTHHRPNDGMRPYHRGGSISRPTPPSSRPPMGGGNHGRFGRHR